MPTEMTLHVGPYAEFLVAEGQSRNHERLEWAHESGGVDHNLEQRERVVIDGVEYERACFAPYFGRDSSPQFKPPRKMHWSGFDGPKELAVADLTEVSVAEEMAWFENAYAEVLRALAEGYGVPGRIRWGVLPAL